MLENITHEFYSEVDSTNDRIKARANEGEAEGLVISAAHQTAGKGRVGRKWQSPVGDSIATSILLRPVDVPVEAVPTVTVIAAMAVREALSECCGLDGRIKWPNDIVVGGKKICGILTEMSMEGSEIKYLVCGIGVNVHNRQFSEDIAFKATSVDIELYELEKNGQLPATIKRSRKEITLAIWESFKKFYNEFLKTYDMTHLKADYEKYLANKDCKVRIEDPNAAYEAIARGINNKGALIVEKDGKEIIIESGEVSVRGIYGYV